MQTPLLDTEAPEVALRTCATCAWSRGDMQTGPLFEGHNRAFCAQPDVSHGDGSEVPCEVQRMQPSSILSAICGLEGIFWTPRQ